MFERFLGNRFFVLYLIPFIIGSLATLSFHPFNLVIINFFIFPIFFYLLVYINKKSKVVYRKKPFKTNFFLFGLSFGFGFYLSGISWITNSLTFDETFKVFIPIALIFIPLFLSLFVALTTLLIGPYLQLNFLSLIIFSGGISFSDYLRSKILTGFPWNLWAYSTTWFNEILQILNLIGLYPYNLLVITVFTVPAIFFFKVKIVKKLLSIFFAIFIIFCLYLYGNYVVNNNNKKLNENSNKVFVKIISPNFDLEYGLTEIEIQERFKKLVRYSDPDKNRKTIFIWPEGVFSGYSYSEILIFREEHITQLFQALVKF